ncbi:hypothetical protein [Solirubrum puertoriconensis]|uniref:Uncharacterized protein n=1 Tax=Solirubrum puertoriconensis TaxID=1751427 RepID=A0A9X0HM61_SOLP1|nr:hypothetical protein [Solirubrum puertoriconensis]KUG08502.1 hypothetical protein ASU33_10090 [Solirubrum puertoriconensis]
MLSADKPHYFDSYVTHLPTPEHAAELPGPTEASQHPDRLNRVMISGASKLLPLVNLLDSVQRQLAQESVFHIRRKNMQAHLAEAYAELRAERPRREALSQAIHTLTELVQEEIRDIHRDEVKQAAKEVALATLRNAPALIKAAQQARLLS